MSTGRQIPTEAVSAVLAASARVWPYPPPRPKFQHNYRRHLIFFGLTFVSTTLASIWLPLVAGVRSGACCSHGR